MLNGTLCLHMLNGQVCNKPVGGCAALEVYTCAADPDAVLVLQACNWRCSPHSSYTAPCCPSWNPACSTAALCSLPSRNTGLLWFMCTSTTAVSADSPLSRCIVSVISGCGTCDISRPGSSAASWKQASKKARSTDWTTCSKQQHTRTTERQTGRAAPSVLGCVHQSVSCLSNSAAASCKPMAGILLSDSIRAERCCVCRCDHLSQSHAAARAAAETAGTPLGSTHIHTHLPYVCALSRPLVPAVYVWQVEGSLAWALHVIDEQV